MPKRWASRIRHDQAVSQRLTFREFLDDYDLADLPTQKGWRSRARECAVPRTSTPQSTAAAFVAADMDGQAGHGLSRVPSYAAQLGHRQDCGSRPTAKHCVPAPASIAIDAKAALRIPRSILSIACLQSAAPECGIASAAIFHSHHIGQAGRTVERLADHGLIALVASNTPQAMAFHGGTRAMLGTNPLAFAAPLPGRPPLVIDLSLSLVARAKIVAAQKAGKSIPSDWATAAEARPPRIQSAALAGAMQPAGGAKGAALALMVEILCGALAGGQFGWEASSFLDDRGPAPGVGQMLIAFDPAAFSGPEFMNRMAAVLSAAAGEAGVRLPGDRRLASRDQEPHRRTQVTSELHAQLVKLAESGA